MKLTDVIKRNSFTNYVLKKEKETTAFQLATEIFCKARPELVELARDYCVAFGASYGTTIACFQLLEEVMTDELSSKT